MLEIITSTLYSNMTQHYLLPPKSNPISKYILGSITIDNISGNVSVVGGDTHLSQVSRIPATAQVLICDCAIL